VTRGRQLALAAFSAALISLAITGCTSSSQSGHAESTGGGEFWGVTDTAGDSSRDFNMMRDAGVGIVRLDLYQEEVETAPGVFHFSSYDKIIGGLASRGIPVLPVLVVSQSHPPPPVGSASARRDWKDFVQAVVARYKPGGAYWQGRYQAQHPGATAQPIGSYQVFNEPNLPKYFPSSNPVRDYATLLRISHDAIRSTDAHAQVVLAGLPGFTQVRGWKFLDQLYRVKGVKSDFDIAAVHPYSPNLSYLRSQMRQFRKVMAQHGDRRTPIWVTEIAYGSAPPNGALGLNKGLRGQARQLTKSFELLRKERRHWHVYGVIWFQWRPQPEISDCSFCSSSGLLQVDYRPKPALAAFERFTR
jgi:polysaccharide biosynthesis protein PslG